MTGRAKKTSKRSKLPPPKTGAGRPRKPAAADGGSNIDAEILQAEADRAAATAAHRAAPTLANKRALLEAEIRCAEAHAARCRLSGNYTHGLKFGELVAKLSAQHAVAVDQKMADDLARIEQQQKREAGAAEKVR